MPKVKMFDESTVLQKAIELFWVKGYYNTSMQDLVEHLGINRGSLYDTYGSKKELFVLAFRKYIKANNENLVRFLDEQKSTKEGLLKLLLMPIEASFCNLGNKGCFAVNTTAELLPDDNEIHEILRKNRLDLENIFAAYLKKGMDQGEISGNKNINELASFLYTMLNGILVIAKINPDKKYLSDILNTGLSVLDG